MVTRRPQRIVRTHLYIKEHMEARGISDDDLAQRLATNRTTVWRWYSEQHRLNPEKIAEIARAISVEPEELWRPPGLRSLDAIMKGRPPEVIEDAAQMLEIMVRRR